MKGLGALLCALEQKINDKLMSNVVFLKKEKSISFKKLRSFGEEPKKLMEREIEKEKEKLLKEILEDVKNNIEVRMEDDGLMMRIHIKSEIIILKEIPSFEKEIYPFVEKISKDFLCG